jgi:tetratricopeptide (TPR) repeat protein
LTPRRRDDPLESLESLKSVLASWNAILAKVVDLNNQGIAHEKRGDLESAVLCYEENSKLRYPASHSYDRLMVVYRRLGKVDEEIRVIHIANEVQQKEIERRKALGGYTANVEEMVNKYRASLERLLKKKQANDI